MGAGLLTALGFGLRARRRRGRNYLFADRVALITGGSRGLGLLLAGELADRGARVAICARNSAELEEARAWLTGRGAADVLAVPCDISDSGQVANLIARVMERFGRLDILVNNAGIIQVGPVESMTLADFDQAMAVNFRGAVDVTLAALPLLRLNRGARIANITSIGGKVAVPHLLPYDASKFALVGFSEGLRAELQREGIRVTTVVPGLMRMGSSLHATYKGNPGAEASWFMAGAALPLSAMDPARAARRIVGAIARGDATVTLSWQAKILRMLHALAPGATATLLGVVNRILPLNADTGAQEGKDAIRGVRPAFLRRLVRREGLRTHEI
jgi:NAD(P)-dependent dehydrogenase (short-subunit alcohol dehydrogenase family)